ncbi:GEVED domain-containing protein [Desulfobacula sp.]|uniref:GEVED domain-containing protein n=1 Tax=Desulfobacula sp. TaxID=2593537 RepID=UPI00260CA9F2|nr:GEVED domain-containing protein [Desulfobacula sp.]
MKKILLNGLVIVIYLSFFIPHGFGATLIQLSKEGAIQSQLSMPQPFSVPLLKSIIGLSGQEDLKLLKQHTEPNNIVRYRYNQLYKGIPIWGYHILVARNALGNVIGLFGTKVTDIAPDIPDNSLTAPAINAQTALSQMKQRHITNSPLSDQTWIFENEVSKQVIYIDNSNQAKLAYLVSFFADVEKGGHPARPTLILDAITQEILREFNALMHSDGTGPGGNEKTGEYYYSLDFPAFDVTQSGMTCTMETAEVKTINLNNSPPINTAYAYPCYENTVKEINGAFSPINDAHFFGGIVCDMYHEWFDTPPLTFQLVLRVHYGTDYENAFWNGSSVTFGDGASVFYPLVGLDIVSHEIGHGFTGQHSGLNYSGQSGGINEAFSDMAGEAAEFYFRGSNDFQIGYDIIKGTGALRYMDDPPKDGKSIDSADDFYVGQNVHYSSGVFNKAFYLLATTAGWNTRTAFEVFVKANQNYWQPSTDFVTGAQGVLYAAIDLGYAAQDVVDAFAEVDIFIDNPQNGTADFTVTTDLLTASFTDISSCSDCTIISWDWDFGDGTGSIEQNPVHTYLAPGTYTVTLSVTDNKGETNSKSKSVKVGTLPEYCETGGSNQAFEWIQTVSVGDFSNTTGASSYSDFSDQVIEVSCGSTYAISLTPGFAGSVYTEYWRIWADLNQDGDFDDAFELLFEGSGNGVVPCNIAFSSQAVPGKTRMRVSMKYGSYASDCGSFVYGEVEDYTLNIYNTGPIEPTAAFNYTVDGLSATFTDASLSPGSSIESWDWNFGDGNSATDQHPEHIYTKTGSYIVTLTVTASNAQTASISKTINVDDTSLAYCESNGSNQTYEWVKTVSIGNFSNNSAASGYSDFTGQIIEVTSGSSSPISLTPGFTGSAYTEYWRIWADLNRDKDFDDIGEFLFEGSGSEKISGQITIPSNISPGDSRLRVTMSYGSNTEACGSFNYGEVEDYTLRVSDGGPVEPTAAFSYTVDGLSATFTDASLSPGSSIESWDWNFGDGNSATDQHPEHIYTKTGSYIVTLTVTASNAQTASISKTINVDDTSLAYCESNGSNQTYEWVKTVSIGNFSNNSAASGYSDFTGQIIEVTSGSSSPIVLTPGFSGSAYNEHWRIWADLNRDGDFDNSSELLFEGSDNKAIYGQMTIPADTPTGTTRLRISMQYKSYTEACDNYGYGEVEDYTLNIQ